MPRVRPPCPAPIWPGAGYGEILPLTNTSVEFAEYMDYQNQGMRMTRMKLNGEFKPLEKREKILV